MLNIDLRANWVLNTINMNHSEFTKFIKKILDFLNEYQQKTMTMKVLLVKLKHKDKELWDQLKDKDVEVEQLKTELTSQKEEQEEPGEDSEELEEMRKTKHNLKTQLEESKRIEEILKNQLEEKEQTIQKLEMEVVGLRKKIKRMMILLSSRTI